jgi:hypothetical protein
MRGKRLGALAPPCDGVRLCDMSTDHQTRASALHGEPNSLWRELGLVVFGPYATYCLHCGGPAGQASHGQRRLFGLF